MKKRLRIILWVQVLLFLFTAWWMGSKPILNYEDGTTPLHQAAEFLEICEPEPRMFYDINIILNQELENMYAEGKSAEETAEIIDNRIQLYLDE